MPSLANAPVNRDPQSGFMGHSSADWSALAARVAAMNAPQSNGEQLSGRGSFYTPAGHSNFPQGFGLRGYANYQGGQQSPLAAFAAPPAPTDYMSLYQKGLNDAKASIAQRLQGDLGYIQQQQALAGQAIGQLPGGINAAYDQAASTNLNAENMITSAQKKSGVGSLTPLGSYMAPVNAALAGTRTADLQNVPLLSIGAQQEANQERALALQGASQDQSALQAQQMDFYAQQAQAQAAARAQQDAANATALQNYAYSKQLQDDPNRNFGPSASMTAGTAPVLDKNGMPQGYTPNDLAKATKSASFSAAKAQLTAATTPQQQAMIWREMTAVYAKQPAMLAALASVFPNGVTPDTSLAPSGPASADYFGIDLNGTPLGRYAFHPGR